MHESTYFCNRPPARNLLNNYGERQLAFTSGQGHILKEPFKRPVRVFGVMEGGGQTVKLEEGMRSAVIAAWQKGPTETTQPVQAVLALCLGLSLFATCLLLSFILLVLLRCACRS